MQVDITNKIFKSYESIPVSTGSNRHEMWRNVTLEGISGRFELAYRIGNGLYLFRSKEAHDLNQECDLHLDIQVKIEVSLPPVHNKGQIEWKNFMGLLWYKLETTSHENHHFSGVIIKGKLYDKAVFHKNYLKLTAIDMNGKEAEFDLNLTVK